MKPITKAGQSIIDQREALAKLGAEMDARDPERAARLAAKREPKPERKPCQDVPEDPRMRCTAHGNRGKGGYLYLYRNDEYGITMSADRENRWSAEVRIWLSDDLPGQQADTFVELREGMLSVPRETT